MPQQKDVQKHYDTWSRNYDSAANPTRDLNAEVLRSELRGRTWRRVLEIGCGTGINTAWLIEHAGQVEALDFSEGMLAEAKRRLLQDSVQFVVADVTGGWPVVGGFDLVVATLVLEHMRDLGHVFSEAYRVLRPGGTLYIAELHPYKQLVGSQARYDDPARGQNVLVPAYRHEISEFVNEGIGGGFQLHRMGEWQGPEDTMPRLLSLEFERQ